MAQDIPASVGWLTVTAEGITALADSIDVGDVPDSRPMLGTIDFATSLNAPIVAIAETPAKFISMDPIPCVFDENGVMRPPSDGSDPADGGIDLAGNVRLVAPDQPAALSVFGWTWTATFKPGSGQKWRQFTVNFGGAPSDTINLADEYAEQKAASAGAFSPMIRKVDGPYTPGDPLPADVKPGMYVLDESTGNIYLVADDSSVGFWANIKPEFTDATVAPLITAGGDTETALNDKFDEDDIPASSTGLLRIAGTESGLPAEVKPTGDSRPGVWEFAHRAASGYIFHLMARAGFTGGALIGLGLEAESEGGNALLISMKAATVAAVGISMADRPDLAADSKFIDLYMQNTTGARGIVVSQSSGTAGAALSIYPGATASTDQDLVTFSGNGYDAMKIKSKTGEVQFYRNTQVRTRTGRLDLRAGSDAADEDSVDHIFGQADNIEFRTWSGAAGKYFPKRLRGDGQSLLMEVADTTDGGRFAATTYLTAFEVKYRYGATQLALYGGTMVSQPSRAGQLTDSSGGTSGGNTVAAVTDTATAANAIATITARLNLLEGKISAAGTGIGVTA